jgi:hypothetical protein
VETRPIVRSERKLKWFDEFSQKLSNGKLMKSLSAAFILLRVLIGGRLVYRIQFSGLLLDGRSGVRTPGQE